MKWILAHFRRSKSVILAILEALNFDFLVVSHLKMSKTAKNSKFIAAEMFKMAVLGSSKDQNWFHVKSKWQWNLQLSHVA